MAGFSGSPPGLSTDPLWAASGDIVYATGDDASSVLGIGSAGYVLTVNCDSTLKWAAGFSGPACSTDNAIVRFDGATGALIQDSGITISDSNVLTANAGIVVDNFTLDGTELDLSSGSFTLDVAADIEINADGGCINFKDADLALAAIVNSSCVGELRIHEAANYVGFKAPALSGNQIWTLPAAVASCACDVLTCNGSGVLSWATAGGGTCVAGTTDNGILTFVNCGSTFAAEASLTFDNAALSFDRDHAGNNAINLINDQDDSAASTRLTIQTGHANGGDAVALFHAGGTSYLVGVDNSDSNIFKIAATGGNLGTNDRFEIKCDGTVGIHNKLGVGTVDPCQRFHFKGSGYEQAFFETTSTSSAIALKLKKAACSTGGTLAYYWTEGSGNGSSGNQGYEMGYTPHVSGQYFFFWSGSAAGAGSATCVYRIPPNQSSIDANTTWDANVFDTYDDAQVLERAFSADYRSTVYECGKAILKGNYEELIEMGVLRKYNDCWVGYNDQRMAALLAGGIYQTRNRLDVGYEELKAEIAGLKQQMGGVVSDTQEKKGLKGVLGNMGNMLKRKKEGK